MTHRHTRLRAVVLSILCGLALTTVWQVPTGAALPCNKATGLTETPSEGWAVTSWEQGHVYTADWQHYDPRRVAPFERAGHGVARGPNGSLWTLESDDNTTYVTRRTDRLHPETTRTLTQTTLSTDSDGVPTDLSFNGRWLVLTNGTLLAYDANWSNLDDSPATQALVPENATGLAATNDTLAFITRNGTVRVYTRTTDGYEHTTQFSVTVTRTAVDVYPGSNGTWLVLQPGNVTAVTETGERQRELQSFFITEGCYQTDSSGIVRRLLQFAGGVLFAGGLLIVVGLIAVGAVLLGLAGILWYVRSR